MIPYNIYRENFEEFLKTAQFFEGPPRKIVIETPISSRFMNGMNRINCVRRNAIKWRHECLPRNITIYFVLKSKDSFLDYLVLYTTFIYTSRACKDNPVELKIKKRIRSIMILFKCKTQWNWDAKCTLNKCGLSLTDCPIRVNATKGIDNTVLSLENFTL